MDLYIDTEFNGYKGELISMALIDEEFNYFYEVVGGSWVYNTDKWVKRNVVPILHSGGFYDKYPLEQTKFQNKLQAFINNYTSVHIIADWPDDIKYFNEWVILGPGIMMDIPSYTTEVIRNIGGDSKYHHNAFWDAISNAEYCMGKKYEG